MGSAESEEYAKTLDSVLVGPVPAGRHMFVFQVRRRVLTNYLFFRMFSAFFFFFFSRCGQSVFGSTSGVFVWSAGFGVVVDEASLLPYWFWVFTQ